MDQMLAESTQDANNIETVAVRRFDQCDNDIEMYRVKLVLHNSDHFRLHQLQHIGDIEVV